MGKTEQELFFDVSLRQGGLVYGREAARLVGRSWATFQGHDRRGHFRRWVFFGRVYYSLNQLRAIFYPSN